MSRSGWRLVSPRLIRAQVKVTPIPADQKHPAAGQFGLFAAQTLAPGEHVMDYLGLVMLYEHCNAGTGCLLPSGLKFCRL